MRTVINDSTALQNSNLASTGHSVAARLVLVAVCLSLSTFVLGQRPYATSRSDNTRGGANVAETLLTPSNVNMAGFGRLFSFPLDYVAMAQPLYVPNVSIPGQGTHNVVYVATQADTLYAIDADSGAQIWSASMLNGGAVANGTFLPCGTNGGFDREGVVGTPVIDSATNTMYLVAKTLLNTTVRLHLHALDITTGAERPGSPKLITAKSTSVKGHVTTFNSLHQKNRPGLLLVNGVLYMGFGSNYCNDGNSGWVLSYDPTSLAQLNVFNTSPDYGLVSIWQAGVGLAADAAGDIYVETGECGAHGYDVPAGGQSYCNSVLKLSPNLTLLDYFTPWNVAFLNSGDFDLSSTGAIVLPDQPGAHPHELIASGKQGIAYVIDRDHLGMYMSSGTTDNVVQEVTLVPGSTKDVLFGSPAYWNNTVYFAPDNSPLLAYPLSNGQLGTPITSGKYAGSHSPSISANGNTNGVLWVISGPGLYALDATTMKLIYTTNQAPGGRDTLPAVGHFATQTVANGKVFVATKTTLEVYGLFNVATVTGGKDQSALAASVLPQAIQVRAVNPYSSLPDVGATIKFTDGCLTVGSISCGTFNPPTAVTNSTGFASSTYTLPKKSGTYTLTMSGTGVGKVTTTATATVGPVVKILANGGSKQTGAAGSTLPNPLVAKAVDVNNNGVAGVTINFTVNNGGILTPTSAVTDSTGVARTSLQLPTTVATVTVNATAAGLNKISFIEYSVAGAATAIAITDGNFQSGTRGTQLALPLTVTVTDQYGNPVSGNSVSFNDGGIGGAFADPNPGLTSSSGSVSQHYTLPSTPGSVAITATASGVNSAVQFTETSN